MAEDLDLSMHLRTCRDKLIGLITNHPAPIFLCIQLAVRAFAKEKFIIAYIATILFKIDFCGSLEKEIKKVYNHEEVAHHALVSYLTDLLAVVVVLSCTNIPSVCVLMAVFQSLQLLSPKLTMNVYKTVSQSASPVNSPLRGNPVSTRYNSRNKLQGNAEGPASGKQSSNSRSK